MIYITNRKFEKEHLNSFNFSNMEARALSCFNTGNIMTKCTRPFMMRTRDKGDRSCLFNACVGDWTATDTSGMNVSSTPQHTNKDNALFLLKLDKERRVNIKLPIL